MIRAPTASTPGAPPAADHATLYEALRQRALERVPPLTRHGLTVVLRQGLPAWMDAWSTVLTGSAPAVPAPTSQPGPVADAMGADVVHLLTAMTLGHIQPETLS